MCPRDVALCVRIPCFQLMSYINHPTFFLTSGISAAFVGMTGCRGGRPAFKYLTGGRESYGHEE